MTLAEENFPTTRAAQPHVLRRQSVPFCGEKYGDFAEHSFGEWKANAEGKRTKVCSACGKVANFMYGNLNYDGNVNAIDRTILRRYLARYSSEIDIAVAGFNGDGKVNTLDLMLLRRFLVGYDSVLGK